MKFGGFGDSTSSSIENKLKTICLSRREIEKKRITVVNLRMNERSSNCTSSSMINGITNTSEITNMIKT